MIDIREYITNSSQQSNYAIDESKLGDSVKN